MVIRIQISSAFEGGIPFSERRYPTHPADEKPTLFTPTPLDPERVDGLQKKIFREIASRLAPNGVELPSLHPILRAALTQDARNLASYLLRSCGHESRALLDFKNILELQTTLVAQLPASHYEPVLMAKGCNPQLARILANLSLRIGRQIAEVAQCRRKVVKAILVFSRPAARRNTLIKSAMLLLDASNKCSAVETIFFELNKSPNEFIHFLRSIVQGGEVNRQRMIEIVTEIAPILATPRGRKPTAASAAHEFLLQHMQCGYTWHVTDGDYTDALTRATRLEFGDPDFSPCAARRRVNARQG